MGWEMGWEMGLGMVCLVLSKVQDISRPSKAELPKVACRLCPRDLRSPQVLSPVWIRRVAGSTLPDVRATGDQQQTLIVTSRPL